jgi:hypothetical protein
VDVGLLVGTEPVAAIRSVDDNKSKFVFQLRTQPAKGLLDFDLGYPDTAENSSMIIPIQLPAQVSPPEYPLPTAFATLSSNEIVIIELQGSIETEGDHTNQIIGMLDMSNQVRLQAPARPA